MKDKIKNLLKQYDNNEIDSDEFTDTILEYMGYGNLYAGDDDELYTDTLKLVEGLDYISSSVLQRRFRIGYARAVRLLDRLEEAGIIRSSDNSGKKEVVKQSK